MSTPATPANYQRLKGSERRPSPTARLLGPADAQEKLSITIVLRRRTDGPPMPDMESIAANPPSQRLSADEFTAKYGAHPDDLAQVVAFVKAQGLTVEETQAARRTVVASGTVAQMSQAFALSLGQYEDARSLGRRNSMPQVETYRGRDGFIQVPKSLAPLIVGIFGLDNRRVTKRNGGDPANTTTLTVPQITKLYNFPTNSAAGQTIAILSEDGYSLSDIQKYFATLPAGYSMPAIQDVAVDAANLGHDPYGETTQDICIAASAAPGAAIAVYFTSYGQKGWVDLLGRLAHPNSGDPLCSVLSSSFYLTNGDDAATLQKEGLSPAMVDTLSASFQDAALQGITICIASGDTGTDSKVHDGKAHVQYPASDPWVLSVGGTTVGNVSGATFDEYVWNDTFFGNQGGATGGGISDHFGLPSYQQTCGVPKSLNDNHVGRGVPDVAANASPNSGYSPMYLNGQPMVGNGTSASAPLWAGLIALLNAALGKPVGFLNPKLYQFGSSVFRDIKSPPGPADNGLNGVPGYPDIAGWDACTGWGSPNGSALLQALKGPIHVCVPVQTCAPIQVCAPAKTCAPAKICAPAKACAPATFPCAPKLVCQPVLGCVPQEIYVATCGPVQVVLKPGTQVVDPAGLQQQIQVVKQDIAKLKTLIAQRTSAGAKPAKGA